MYACTHAYAVVHVLPLHPPRGLQRDGTYVRMHGVSRITHQEVVIPGYHLVARHLGDDMF